MAERDVRLITKRTSVPGKIPTGTTGNELNLIKQGELASNLADKKLYSFDGSNIFEFGSNSFLNLTGGTVSGNTRIIGSLSATNIYGDLIIDNQPNSTYSTLQEWINNDWSAGRISGGELFDNGDGSVGVLSGTGMIKTVDNILGQTIFFDWDQNLSISLANNMTNYIYVDYNLGTPILTSTTDYQSVTQTTQFILNTVYRENNKIFSAQTGTELSNLPRKIQRRISEAFGFQRVSGIITSESGTRNIAITSGVVWIGLNRNVFPAFDSSISDTFDVYYRDGGTGFTVVTGVTQIDNTTYDDGSGTPATLTNNRYGSWFVFVSPGGKVSVLMGQTNLNLNNTRNTSIPANLPGIMSDFSLFAAKIIIQKNAVNFTEIQLPYDTLISQASVNNHNELAGLQGGTAGEYYHLTNSEYTIVSNIPNILDTKASLSGAVFTGGIIAPSLSATTISGGTLYSGSTSLYDIFQPINKSPYNTYILTAGTSYTFTGIVNTLSINKTTGSSTQVNLPSNPNVNDFFVVKDRKGDSKTNPITVSGGTKTIDGNTSYIIKAKNNPSLTFLFDGEEYIVI